MMMNRLADISQFELLMNPVNQQVHINNFHSPASQLWSRKELMDTEDLEDIFERADDIEDRWSLKECPEWLKDELIEDESRIPCREFIGDVIEERGYVEKLRRLINSLSELDKERLRLYRYVTPNTSNKYLDDLVDRPNRHVPMAWMGELDGSELWGEGIRDIDSLYNNISRERKEQDISKSLSLLKPYLTKKGRKRLGILEWIRKNHVLDQCYPVKSWEPKRHDTKAPGYPIKQKVIQALRENKDKFGRIGDKGQEDILEEVIRGLGNDAYNLSNKDRLMAMLTLHMNPASRDRAEKMDDFLFRLLSTVWQGGLVASALEEEAGGL